MKIESKWDIVRIKDLCEIGRGRVINKKEIESNSGEYPVYSSQTSNEGIFGHLNTFDFEGEYVTWTTDGIYAGSVFYRNGKFNCTNVCGTLKAKSDSVNMRYLAIVLPNYTDEYVVKVANPKLMNNVMAEIKIPFPPFDIQQKIVSEIEALEKQKQKATENIEKLRTEIETNFKNIKGNLKRLDEICELKAGNFVKAENISKEFNPNLFPCYGGNGLRGYTETFTNEGQFSLVGRQGALCGNVHLISGKFHATEHALVAYPKEGVNAIWLHYQLVFMNLNQYATGAAQPGLCVINLNPIEILVPTISDQKKIVVAIEKIENKISILQKEISAIPKLKEEILKKYL